MYIYIYKVADIVKLLSVDTMVIITVSNMLCISSHTTINVSGNDDWIDGGYFQKSLVSSSPNMFPPPPLPIP